MATVDKRGGRNQRGVRYYISYFDHNGQRVSRSARTTDKATAERIVAKFEADAALRRDGVIDPALDAICQESRRTVESHLGDFEAKLKSAGRSRDHVARTVGFIQRIRIWAKWTHVSEIAADAVHRYAANLQSQGKSARTIQARLTAIKSFTRWLSEQHKLPRDPLRSVRKPNPNANRVRYRRPLRPEEWMWLGFTVAAGPARYGVSARERLLLYQTAIQTGLRSNELRRLKHAGLFLNAQPPFIVCSASATKNRKDARQYINSQLARDLAAQQTARGNAPFVFRMPHETNVVRMIRDDLEAARERWLQAAEGDDFEMSRRLKSDFLAVRNHDGQWFDFHSLRHTCGAWLASSGVHPKVVQTIMRHSTITLTMDTYGHLFPGQEADAVTQVEAMLSQAASRANVPEALKCAAHLQRAGGDHLVFGNS